ncbi:hypothetical protein [Sphingobium sp. Ant17]|uniref:hypothetical protein n=1 Tax=Sphingobium sp. Ant17 TaxID=1461752 RepID=UPI00044CB106|nr:hypothetical protein [Sphingobium sp. Ant17]EXS68597.1 hypothetical protein BF95_02975 [Sphingobium sp. Ant17]
MDGIDDLRQFENEADTAIAAMPIMALPARAVLAGLHYFLWVTQHAGLLDLDPQPGVSETAIRRMGYLLPLLVRRQAEPFGVSARDALDGFLKADPTGEQMAQLLSYAHFSEFMPEAHKKYYTVTTIREGFRLVLRSEWFEQMQARDILLSELALVFPFPAKKELDPVLREIVRDLPDANWDLVGPLLGRKIEALLFSLAEPNLVAPEGMERIFGSGYSGFYRIRAAILAYAELALEISMILGATSNRENDGKGISDETLEWISCNVEAEWFVGLIARLSAAEPGMSSASSDFSALISGNRQRATTAGMACLDL